MCYVWNSRSFWDLDECDDMGAKKNIFKNIIWWDLEREDGCVLLLCAISICILSRIADSCTTWCCAYHHAEPGALAPASAGTQTLHRGFWDFPFDSTTRQTFQKAAAAFRCTFITPQKKKNNNFHLNTAYSTFCVFIQFFVPFFWPCAPSGDRPFDVCGVASTVLCKQTALTREAISREGFSVFSSLSPPLYSLGAEPSRYSTLFSPPSVSLRGLAHIHMLVGCWSLVS